MIDVDRMVGRLMKLMKDAHLATSLSSSCEDSIAEVVFSNHLRAAEGKQYSAWLNLFEALDIEACVALQGIMKSSTMLSKGWRVENDKVVFAIVGIKEFESILAESLMALVARKVEVDVGIGKLNSLSTTIYRVHQLGSATHSIDRETASIAEHIKHTLAMRIFLEQ